MTFSRSSLALALLLTAFNETKKITGCSAGYSSDGMTNLPISDNS